MDVMLTNISDVLTRKVSKHGIIHGLDSFPGRTVKILVLEPDTPTISTPAKSEIAYSSELPPYGNDYPVTISAESHTTEPVPDPQPNKVVFAGGSSESSPEDKSTVSKIRAFVSD